MKNVVEVIKLWKKYPSTSFVLTNINLFVPEGTIVGVIGENKSGKSTLINVIMGQLSYDSGLVKICGQVVDGRPLEALNDIGFVSNECRFHGCLSCYEIGNIMQHIYTNWDQDLYHKYLRELGVNVFRRVENMSRSTQTKLMLAVALGHSPRLLVLDEVTTGLDPDIRANILYVIKSYVSNGKNSVIFASSMNSDIDRIADKVIYLDDGHLIFEANMDVLKSRFVLYSCSNLNYRVPLPEKVAVVAKYTDGNTNSYLLDKDRTMLIGSVPTIDDFICFYRYAPKKRGER
jgi:ABC-2 type transport system ATP-binding protein